MTLTRRNDFKGGKMDKIVIICMWNDCIIRKEKWKSILKIRTSFKGIYILKITYTKFFLKTWQYKALNSLLI